MVLKPIDRDLVVIFSIAASDDSNHVVGCTKLGHIFLWNLSEETNTSKFWFQPSEEPLYNAITYGGNLLVGGAEGIFVWNWENLKRKQNTEPICRIRNPDHKWKGGWTSLGAEVNEMVVCPHTRQLFCATGDPVCTQFDLNTEKHVQSFEGHDEYLLSVCVQSNILTTGSCDGTIKIWDVRTGSCITTLDPTTGREKTNLNKKTTGYVPCVDMHLDGSALLTGSTYPMGALLLWDLGQREVMKSMPIGCTPQVCKLNEDLTCFSGENSKMVRAWSRNEANNYVDARWECNVRSIWDLLVVNESLVVCGVGSGLDVFTKPFSSPRNFQI